MAVYSSVAGVLPAAVHASAQGMGLICPASQGGEAAWAGEFNILAANSLLDLINHFKGSQVLRLPEVSPPTTTPTYADMADIKGQETAKRAVEIAATVDTICC